MLVAAFAGVASARLGGGSDAASPAPAPMLAPRELPRPVQGQSGAFALRGLDELSAPYERSGDAAGPTASAGGATVTVSAIVLPVVFLVLDADGEVVRIATNSPDRDPAAVLFLPRLGDEAGAPVALDQRTWELARTALADARAGTGTIWSA